MNNAAPFDFLAAPMVTTLAAIGLIAGLAVLAGLVFVALGAARRLTSDDFAGLYGTYYGYRAPLNPDPLLPLPLGVHLDIVRSHWRRHPRAIWQNPSLDSHAYVTGRAFRNADGFTVVLDEQANLPFVITVFDLTRVGFPDIKVGVQSGLLQSHNYPYAAPVLFSRRPLDQLAAAEALKRLGAIRVTVEAARTVAEQALAGTPPAMTVLAGAVARNAPSEGAANSPLPPRL